MPDSSVAPYLERFAPPPPGGLPEVGAHVPVGPVPTEASGTVAAVAPYDQDVAPGEAGSESAVHTDTPVAEHEGFDDEREAFANGRDDDNQDDFFGIEQAAIVIGRQLKRLSKDVIWLDQENKRRESEERRKEKEANDALLRKMSIVSHLGAISEAVDGELHFARVLDAKDKRLGMTKLLGEAVVAYTLGKDRFKQHHPESITSVFEVGPGMFEINRTAFFDLLDRVVESTTGTSAGAAFLRVLIGEGRVSAPIAESIRENLPKLTRAQRKAGLDEFDLIDDEKAWALLKDAYVIYNRENSLNSHFLFFPSTSAFDETTILAFGEDDEPVRSGDEVWLQHDMVKDFHDAATVLEFIEGRDFEDASPGSLHAGYIIRPMVKPPDFGSDSMDKIKELAGKNIASVGQNSFVALINANKSPELLGESDAHGGAYMILGYEPRMPAHDAQDLVELEEEGIKIRVVQDGSEDEVSDNIYWKARVWRLSNTAYSIIRDILDEHMEDPDSPYQPFIDPGETLAQGYKSQEVVFSTRAVAVAEVERNRRLLNQAAETVKGQLAVGEQPTETLSFETPRLSALGNFTVMEAAVTGKLDDLLARLLLKRDELDPEIKEAFDALGINLADHITPLPVKMPSGPIPIEATSTDVTDPNPDTDSE